jgi:beta-glucosidase
MKTTLGALGALACLAMGTANAADNPAANFHDATLPIEERVTALVASMTLQEKAAQLGHTAPAIPRLGIPEYNWWNEGLHGVARAGIATVFPQAIAMAASWDVKLMKETADVIATEFRAKYIEKRKPDGGAEWYRGLTVWSPNINIFRDPRWGRGQETYGEDPYLTSRLGVAFVQGLQGGDPNYFKTIATAKHFAVHSGPESNRHKEDVYPSARDLADTYLPAFRATVMEGKVDSVMCVYNAVNGIPGCASAELMDSWLRKKWGFNGFVVSDCGAAANIFRPDSHHWKPNAAEGVAAGIKAGMDLICGDYRNDMSTEPEGIAAAVTNGFLSQAELDQAVQRLFVARIKLGLFDPPAKVPYSQITPADNDTPAHREVALNMAKASLVLLKNQDGFLPLKTAPATIAVIGPNADNLDALLGNYNGTPTQPVTVLKGLRERFPKSKVLFAEGVGLIGAVAVPVPASALADLKLLEFSNRDLEGAGTPLTSASTIGLTWEGRRRTALRWTGALVAPESGEFGFGYVSHAPYRIWVNDKLIMDDWVFRDAPSLGMGKISLEAGKRYAIRVEAAQSGSSGEQKLTWSLPSSKGEDAVAAAKQADLVVFVGGLSARVEGEEMRVTAPGFAGGDRSSLDLPGPQQQLLERVHATGKPVVLVLMNGSAMSVNWADAKLPAIVEAWYPGGDGGRAVAALLAGDFSPSGRLPVTFYKSAEELPPFTDYAMKNRTYRYFTGEPLYPFGFGLGYTTFKYEAARVNKPNVAANGEVIVSVDVTNTGAMAGDEVVQLYVSHPGNEHAPLRSLQGFQRVHLGKGEKKTVEFRLRNRALAVVDEAGKFQIAPGNIDVWVGGGQPVVRAGLPATAGARTKFAVTSGTTLPD